MTRANTPVGLSRAATIAVIGAVIGLIAGCGGSSSPAAGKSLQPAAASTSSSCTSLAYNWAHSGDGEADIVAVGADFGDLAKDFPEIVAALEGHGSETRALRRATNDASNLGAAATTALADPPPACVPGELAPYRSAMAEANEASVDTLNSVNDISAGNDAGATTAIEAEGNETTEATKNLAAATAAISAFNKIGG